MTKARVREIAHAATDSQGATFSCHATVDYSKLDDEEETSYHPEKSDRQCAGALIFAEKQGRANQSTRIAERLGLYDATRLDQDAFPLVFDSLREMLKTAER